MPFGEVGVVKDWLKITGDVVKPENEHPKRLIEGLQCKRKEVSGRRFWEFKNCPCPNAEKVFSFIDPCGIKEIPHTTIERFLGPRKEVFINLMVMTIRRVSANPVASGAISKLFGSSEAASIIRSLYKTDKKEAYQQYVSLYEKQIEKICGIEVRNAIHFLFSKGRKSPDIGDQFFMVYCNYDHDLESVGCMKSAMMGKVQTLDGELRHTDYYYFNDIYVPLGRKTTDQDEGTIIYNKFKGKTVTLDKVKEWILYRSPYPFHSRALKYLEDKQLLHVSNAPESRRRGTFMASKLRLSPLNESNFWRLTFLSDDEDENCNDSKFVTGYKTLESCYTSKCGDISPQKRFINKLSKVNSLAAIKESRFLSKRPYPFKMINSNAKKYAFDSDSDDQNENCKRFEKYNY